MDVPLCVLLSGLRGIALLHSVQQSDFPVNDLGLEQIQMAGQSVAPTATALAYIYGLDVVGVFCPRSWIKATAIIAAAVLI